jgi:hypothetical protein
MPVTPHPIEITLNDLDGSTVKSGARVYVVNATKRTQSDEETTNASGIANIDLANLPIAAGQTLEYESGDEILIIAYDGPNSDAAKYTVTGSSKSQTLNLNPVQHNKNNATERILAIILANTTSTVYYAKVYNTKDGRLLLHMECPANDSKSAYLGHPGLSCGGGVVIERENSGLLVTAVLK